MVSATLSVAVYRRVEHSKSHWAIHLLTRKDGEEEHIIYQAAGDEGKLSVEIREGVDPANSQRLMELILVSELDSTKVVEEARDIMSNQPVQNEVPLWTCQDWSWRRWRHCQMRSFWINIHTTRRKRSWKVSFESKFSNDPLSRQRADDSCRLSTIYPAVIPI
jgi:hypothetical protein